MNKIVKRYWVEPFHVVVMNNSYQVIEINRSNDSNFVITNIQHTVYKYNPGFWDDGAPFPGIGGDRNLIFLKFDRPGTSELIYPNIPAMQSAGDGKQPTILLEPQILEKNTSMKITVYNNSGIDIYFDLVLEGYLSDVIYTYERDEDFILYKREAMVPFAPVGGTATIINSTFGISYPIFNPNDTCTFRIKGTPEYIMEIYGLTVNYNLAEMFEVTRIQANSKYFKMTGIVSPNRNTEAALELLAGDARFPHFLPTSNAANTYCFIELQDATDVLEIDVICRYWGASNYPLLLNAMIIKNYIDQEKYNRMKVIKK